MMKIVNDMSIVDMLEKHLSETESGEIIAIAMSKIVRPEEAQSTSRQYV